MKISRSSTIFVVVSKFLSSNTFTLFQLSLLTMSKHLISQIQPNCSQWLSLCLVDGHSKGQMHWKLNGSSPSEGDIAILGIKVISPLHGPVMILTSNNLFCILTNCSLVPLHSPWGGRPPISMEFRNSIGYWYASARGWPPFYSEGISEFFQLWPPSCSRNPLEFFLFQVPSSDLWHCHVLLPPQHFTQYLFQRQLWDLCLLQR